MKWYLAALRNYAIFSGRARRTEYWMFILFNIIFSIAAMIIDNIIGTTFDVPGIYYGFIYVLYTIAMIIPSISVTVRRLHDTGKSGWMYFIALIPLIGGIWLLVLMCIDSEKEENKYGVCPK